MHDANAAFVCRTCLAWSWSEKVMVIASPLPVLFNWLGTVLGAILGGPLPTVVLSKMSVRKTT